MASGEVVGYGMEAMPPVTLSATFDTRNSASTPAEAVTVWDFDASASEYMDFKGQLRGYGGGGLTVHLKWSASSATSGNCEWEAAFRRVADDAEDIDTPHSYDFNAVVAAAASASGELSYDAIAFTNGSDMDSLAEGEAFILRIRRDTTTGSNMTGDAELWSVLVVET